MYQYLPSKKFLYTVGAIVFAVLIVVTVGFLDDRKKAVVMKDEVSAKQNSMKEFLAIDTDLDGLKDWEESLWKTDPKVADTDQDGTDDWEEVKTNRDPLEKNSATVGQTPSDKIDQAIIDENKRTIEEFQKLNPTDQLSRLFFSQYVDAKNSAGGASINAQTKEDIISNALLNMSTSTEYRFTTFDIRITDKNNSESVKIYINTFGEIVYKYSANAGKELLYLSQIMTGQDNGAGRDLLSRSAYEYTQIVTDMLKLEVPRDLSFEHVQIINYFHNMKRGVEGMKVLESDPLTALVLIELYKNSALGLFAEIQKITDYAAKIGVSFTKNEPGYLITNYK